MDWLQSLDLGNSFLGNSAKVWIIAASIALGLFVLLAALRKLLIHRLTALASRTKNTLDDLIIDLLSETKIWFLFIIGLYVATYSLQLDGRLSSYLHSIALIGLLLQIWFWGVQLIRDIIKGLVGRDPSLADSERAIEGTMPAIEFVGRLILFSIILLLALDNFGFDVTALVASLGIGGIAVALALQNILGDLFASLSILFDKPFRVGDFIVVGDMMGNVEKIGLKTTRVRSLSGEQLIFSNGDLLGSRIKNFKRMSERRIVFALGVTYQTPAQKLRKIPVMIKQTVESMSKVRFDRAHFKNYGDFSLNYEVVYFVLSADFNQYMDIQQEINLRLFEAFEDEGIEFAYPTQTLFVEQAQPQASKSA